MATKILSITYQLKRGEQAAIESKNPILAKGEPIVVWCDDGITRMKICDGTTAYDKLNFIGDVVKKYKSLAEFPVPGLNDAIYISIAERSIYHWNEETAKYDSIGNFSGGSSGEVIILDDFLSPDSTNGVQNKVVYAALENKVDKDGNKVLSTNDYTNEDKDKLSTIESGATKVIVDSALDKNSINAVQNGTVASALETIEAELHSSMRDIVSDTIAEEATTIIEEQLATANLDGGWIE